MGCCLEHLLPAPAIDCGEGKNRTFHIVSLATSCSFHGSDERLKITGVPREGRMARGWVQLPGRETEKESKKNHRQDQPSGDRCALCDATGETWKQCQTRQQVV